MTGWLERIAHASDTALALTVLGALFVLYLGFSGLVRARRIEDVPTARVRSAPQGYVELIGTAQTLGGEPIIAPLSKTACCWFDYRIQRRSGKSWRSVQAETSDGIFVLRDDSGDCVVDPEGAEVTSRHRTSWSDDGSGWGSHGVHARLPSLGRGADRVVQVGGKLLEMLGSGVGEYRYTESVILEGDPLYAIGQFHSMSSAEQTASLNDLTGAILREWKQRPDTLRERFDANRDGTVDVDEWQHARAVARREAAAEHAEGLRRDQLHTLRRPADGRHFLLSNLEEFGLLRRYRWRARIAFAAFALLGGAVALMLSTRVV
ncbi:MAG: GIDE domain-containing protein [Gammaproteobacteria bacterium]|nr:GIDE domain-containing protein [Gammaproteobacteria bacterium]